VGDALAGRPEYHLPDGRRACVIEADLLEGVRAVGLETFAGLPMRICRPVSLSPPDVQAAIAHAVARLGHRYDLKHIFDLMRWLLPKPPVPARWRRQLLSLGSGDPTRAICSMLVAEALQSVRYPILPRVERLKRVDAPELADMIDLTSEVLHTRHASLLVPRDFDLSPYFAIVKPTLARGFDHRQVVWGDDLAEAPPAADTDAAPTNMGSPPAAPPPPPQRGRRYQFDLAEDARIRVPPAAAPTQPDRAQQDSAGAPPDANAGSPGGGWWLRWWQR
jgi:hypothetical protein